MIPQSKEVSFVMKLAGIILASAMISCTLLYLFMDKWVGSDYGTAFRTISSVYEKMNYYIAIAVVIQFFLSSVLLWLVTLRYSHKIAGPIYNLKNKIRAYLKGEEIRRIHFRKGDFLHDLADTFTVFFKSMDKRRTSFKELKTIIEEMDPDNSTIPAEDLEKIRKYLSETE